MTFFGWLSRGSDYFCLPRWSTGEQGILGHQVSKDGDLATAARFHSLRYHKLPVCLVTTASLSRMDLLGVLRSKANPLAFPRPSARWGATGAKWLWQQAPTGSLGRVGHKLVGAFQRHMACNASSFPQFSCDFQCTVINVIT